MNTLSIRDLDVTLGDLAVLRGVHLEVPSDVAARGRRLRAARPWRDPGG